MKTSSALTCVVCVVGVALGAAGGNLLRAKYERTASSIVPMGALAESDSRVPKSLTLLDSGIEPGAYFSYVEGLLAEKFFKEVNDHTALAHGALDEMLAALQDPGSRFYYEKAWSGCEKILQGGAPGIGVDLELAELPSSQAMLTKLVVVSVLDGSSAKDAGVLPKDEIVKIGGRWIVCQELMREWMAIQRDYAQQKISVDQFREQINKFYDRLQTSISGGDAIEKLLTNSGQPVAITILRNGKLTELVCKPKQPDAQLVSESNGAIRIRAFGQGCANQLAAAIQNKGKLVIDIRSNPGGYLDEVKQCLSLLIPAGEFAKYQKEPNGGLIPMKLDRGTNQPREITLIVDSGTAREAELFAAALRDRAKAKLEGGPTFGMGVALERFDLKDGTGYTLTSAHFFDLHGKPLVQAAEQKTAFEISPRSTQDEAAIG
jgi:carboxyl-terminal processing protease